MSLWSRIKETLGFGKRRVSRETPAPVPKPVSKPVEVENEKPERPQHGVDRDVSVDNPAWASVQDYMDSNLTSRGVEAFDDEQDRLAAMFNIVADPHQSEHIKRDAYEELENRLAEFGFLFRGGLNSSTDFDWVEFKVHYPTVD